VGLRLRVWTQESTIKTVQTYITVLFLVLFLGKYSLCPVLRAIPVTALPLTNLTRANAVRLSQQLTRWDKKSFHASMRPGTSGAGEMDAGEMPWLRTNPLAASSARILLDQVSRHS
jgi:hypothetical protein